MTIIVVIFSALHYSYALTKEDILRLKSAGVEDQTIRLMIMQEREAQKRKDGQAVDILGTKEKKDSRGNSTVIYSTEKAPSPDAIDPEQKKLDEAWKMLQNIIIDHRR